MPGSEFFLIYKVQLYGFCAQKCAVVCLGSCQAKVSTQLKEDCSAFGEKRRKKKFSFILCTDRTLGRLQRFVRRSPQRNSDSTEGKVMGKACFDHDSPTQLKTEPNFYYYSFLLTAYVRHDQTMQKTKLLLRTYIDCSVASLLLLDGSRDEGVLSFKQTLYSLTGLAGRGLDDGAILFVVWSREER